MNAMFKGPAAPPTPTPTPPPNMPDPMSPEVLEARRTAMAKGAASGRAGSTLTTPLGAGAAPAKSSGAGTIAAGGAYGGSKTGG